MLNIDFRCQKIGLLNQLSIFRSPHLALIRRLLQSCTSRLDCVSGLDLLGVHLDISHHNKVLAGLYAGSQLKLLVINLFLLMLKVDLLALHGLQPGMEQVC